MSCAHCMPETVLFVYQFIQTTQYFHQADTAVVPILQIRKPIRSEWLNSLLKSHRRKVKRLGFDSGSLSRVTLHDIILLPLQLCRWNLNLCCSSGGACLSQRMDTWHSHWQVIIKPGRWVTALPWFQPGQRSGTRATVQAVGISLGLDSS